MVGSINKRGLALTLFLVLLTMNNVYAKDHILDWKVISDKKFRCSNLTSTDIFVDKDNNTFVLIGVNGTKYYKALSHINNNWIRVDKYGILLNGFIKDGYLHLAFRKDQDVVIYNIREDIKFVSRISIAEISSKFSILGNINRVIPVSGSNNSYYLLTQDSRSSVHPVAFLMDVLSAGHGVHYRKPFLIQVRDKKLAKPRKLRYGGKIDETFLIEEVVKGKDSIHFLGFRGAETPETSGPPAFARNKPVILHYADYDFKKKKTTRKHSICTKTPEIKFDKNTDMNSTDMKSYYGPLSMDNLKDDIFVVFSWVERHNYRAGFNINNIRPDVYYWQYSDNASGDIEKIGNGFSPLVMVDSIGNVHVLWGNSDGCLVHKVKKNGKWSDEKIILNNVDIYPRIIVTRYIPAEFDKDNNLHVVYPSGGSLVHAVVKVN